MEPPMKKNGKSPASATKIAVSIAVTELAPICGMDNYNNWPKLIAKLWKKLYNSNFIETEELLRSNGHIGLACDSTQKKLVDLEQKHGLSGQITNAVKAVNNVKNKSSSQLVSSQDKIIAKATGLIPDQNDKLLLESLVKSATNVVHGVAHEANGLTIFTNVTGQKIVDTQRRVSFKFHEDDKAVWKINGNIDGITDAGYIVEIKNRQKALFGVVRDYEMCQVQAYLHLTGASKGYLVEVLPGVEVAYNIIEVLPEPGYYDRVIGANLTKLIGYMTDVIGPDTANIEIKHKILLGDLQRECYMGYYC